MAATAPPRDRVRAAVLLTACLVAVALVGYFSVYPILTVSRSLTDAREHLAVHDLPAAKVALVRALVHRPDHVEANYLLAQTLRRQGEYQEAEKHLEAARVGSWSPDLIEMERRLARAGLDGLSEDNAKILHLWVNARHPEDRVILEALVRAYRGAFAIDDANRLLGTWIERYPDDWLPLAWRGELLGEFNHFDESLADFEAALARRPEADEVHLRIGELLLRRQLDFPRAERHIRTYLENHPDDADAIAGLARSLWLQSKGDEASATLDRLFALNAGHARGLVLRATIDAAEGRHAEAIAALHRAEKLLPGDREVIYQLAQASAKLNLPGDAERYDRQLRQLEADNREIDRLTAEVLEKPHDADIRSRLGVLLLRSDRDEPAIRWFHGALTIDPQHTATHRALYEYYIAKGNAFNAAMHRPLAGLPKE